MLFEQNCTKVWTDGYAPPEQRASRPEPRSDLFALAATLYHLTTGRTPRAEDTVQDIEAMLNDSRKPIPQEQRWFYELLKINLSANANDRYFSASEIKADLEKRQVTKETRCKECRAVSPVRTAYCTGCAVVLTGQQVTCNDCGKDLSMGSNYCIYCGNRLR